MKAITISGSIPVASTRRATRDTEEAINSMYRWYQDAKVCYAYLSDVKTGDRNQPLEKSVWFRRGWTLQELLAPKRGLFSIRTGHRWEAKTNLATTIAEASGIDIAILKREANVLDGSIAQRNVLGLKA